MVLWVALLVLGTTVLDVVPEDAAPVLGIVARACRCWPIWAPWSASAC